MEMFMIQSRLHLPEVTTSKQPSTKIPSTPLEKTKRPTTRAGMTTQHMLEYDLPNITANYSLLLESNYTLWNTSDVFNVTNDTFVSADYDFRTFNATAPSTVASWTCKEWTPAQHNLFQTTNFFFAFAFIVPGRFKQSVLLVRALLTLGYVFLTFWAAADVCSPDILLWNLLLVILNLTHTVLLTWRFLPPTLTLELTELYLKVFKPLRVSKKHFKELVREDQIFNLERGDIYAVEDVSPADERLSILLKGKLRVTCDDTHLHFITIHQFVDSPEWVANHDQSDDVFQVTITAEEDSLYLCWSRMRLERILRHKPTLKVILDCIIGKDITEKLYSLNEHLTGLEDDRKRVRHDEIWARAHSRSMFMDAVTTGTTGLLRSTTYKNSHPKHSLNSAQDFPVGFQNQCWVPLMAPQFPPTSTFMRSLQPLIHQRHDSTSSSLKPPTPSRTRSFRKNQEVKFQDCIIAKDITQKLYSSNEHLTRLEDDRKRVRHDEIWARDHSRSMSIDAVNTGTTGLVRSTTYKTSHRKHSLNSAQDFPVGFQNQCWIPITAPQFPPTSPFMGSYQPLIHQRHDSTSSSLKPPTPSITGSFRKNREVKFQGVK